MRRLGWGIADQAFSSATNFALAVVVAGSVEPREFGAFSIVFASYTVVLGIARAIATEPLAVRHGAAAAIDLRPATASAAGAALAVAFGGSALAALAAVAASGPLAEGLWALAAVLPGAVLQDAWRMAFFVADRGAAAFLNDLLWAVLLAAGVAVVVTRRGDPSPALLLLVWGGAGTVAALVGAGQTRALPEIGRAVPWLRETQALSSRYVPEFVATVTSAQLSLFGVAAVAGLAATGALRGGQVVLGPLNVLFMGAALVAVPEAVRALETSPERFAALVRSISGGLAAAALAWGAALMALPGDIGRSLLGETWARAEPAILPLTLWCAFLGVIAGPTTAVRALGAAGTGLRAGASVALASVVASVIGAAVAGAEGAAWGLAAAAAAGSALWWYELARA